MIQLLVWRDRIRDFYRNYAQVIIPILRFIAAIVVFTLINQQIGYDERLLKLPAVLLLSVCSAFFPAAVLVFLAAAVVLLHIFAASKLLTLIFLVILLILYCLFVRFAPRYGWVVLAIPVLFHFHIPYAVPLILGLVATPVSALAAGCGVVAYFLFQLLKEAALMATGSIGVEDALALYTYVLKTITGNKQMMLTIGIFVFVILITWLIRRMKIAHAFEIAVVTGTISNILLFLLGDLFLGVSDELLAMILGSLASGVMAYIVQFFHFILDYSATEKVQFEDDDYYYYVRAVPKLKVTTPEVNVKKISYQGDGAGDEQDDELRSLEEGLEEELEDAYQSAQSYEQDRPRRL